VAPLIFGGLLFLQACSSAISQKSADEESIRLSDELNALSKKVQVVNYGPTVKDGALFKDVTQDYGLSGLHAVALNAVDFNFDGHTDLAILPSYYSRPKFMIMDPKLKKFKEWDMIHSIRLQSFLCSLL